MRLTLRMCHMIIEEVEMSIITQNVKEYLYSATPLSLSRNDLGVVRFSPRAEAQAIREALAKGRLPMLALTDNKSVADTFSQGRAF